MVSALIGARRERSAAAGTDSIRTGLTLAQPHDARLSRFAPWGYNGRLITNYVAAALRRARYQTVDGGLFCATVPGLRGVIATAPTVEGCRAQLAEVTEAWLLVRVARGLRVPPLGRTTVHVKRAS